MPLVFQFLSFLNKDGTDQFIGHAEQGAGLVLARRDHASLSNTVQSSDHAGGTSIIRPPTVADGCKCKIRILASFLFLSIIINVILGSALVWKYMTSLKTDDSFHSLQTATYRPEITTTAVNTSLGRCKNQPQIKEECLYENGRTYVQYTVLSRTPTPTSDHCPVSVCSGNNVWSEFKISSSIKECYRNSSGGAVYGGKNTCTETGRTCQGWNIDYPHRRHEDHIPTNPEDLGSNHCRDPGPSYGYKPWCYTTDPNVRWEYCHVPEC